MPRITFEKLETLVEKKNADGGQLVCERRGKTIEVTNNANGTTAVFDTVAEAYAEVYHDNV